jgi:hypothetical protein
VTEKIDQFRSAAEWECAILKEKLAMEILVSLSVDKVAELARMAPPENRSSRLLKPEPIR